MSGGWRIALWVAIVVAAGAFLYLVRGILLPFIVALVIATLLDPLVRKLRMRGFSRKWAALCVIAPIYFAGLVLLVLLAPRVTVEILSFNRRIDDFAASLSQSTNQDNYFIRWNPEVQAEQRAGVDGSIDEILTHFQGPLKALGLPTSRQEIMQQYVEPRRPQIAQAVKGAFESFFGFLTAFAHNLLGLVVVFIVPPFLLIEMEDMRRRAPRYIPPAIRASTLDLLADIGQVFMKYLRGVATVMVLYMVCAGILMSLLGVPFAILLAILFAALYMVPYLGNIIVYITLFCIVGFTGTQGTFFMHLGSPWVYAVVVTAVYALMGLLFDQLVYPSMVGNAVGLNTVASIFVVFCGGALFGLVGMIIAFPLAGAIKIILDRILRFTSTTQDRLSLPSVPLRHRRSAAA